MKISYLGMFILLIYTAGLCGMSTPGFYRDCDPSFLEIRLGLTANFEPIIYSPHQEQSKTLLTLPNADTLKKRLDENGFKLFRKTTKFHKEFGGFRLFAFQVPIAVKVAGEHFKEITKGKEVNEPDKIKIINLILADYPAEIAELHKIENINTHI